MPWPVNTTLYNYNEFSVRLNAPAECGVWMLVDDCGEPLRVGSGDVLLELLRELERGEAQAMGAAFFSYFLASCNDCEQIAAELAAELLAVAV